MTGMPLDGIMVVSIEQAVAAPFATRQLADLGARVIKIERPVDGDFARHYDERVGSRVEHRRELIDLIEAVFADLTSEQVITRLDAAQIANARQNEISDLIAHPQLSERDRWRVVDSPVGPIQALRPPAIIQGMPERMDPIPGVGQHTDQILSELGVDGATVAAMLASGTV